MLALFDSLGTYQLREIIVGIVSGVGRADAGAALAGGLIDLMHKVELPNGLNGVGITAADLDTLVAGTLPQERITRLSPRPATEDDYRDLFRQSMRTW